MSNSIVVNVATSVNDLHQQKASFYPNPNNGTFTLQFNNDSINRIEVVNTFGQVIYTAEIQKTAVF